MNKDGYCGRLALLLVVGTFIVGWYSPPSNGIGADGAVYFGGVQIGALSANGLQVDALIGPSDGPLLLIPGHADGVSICDTSSVERFGVTFVGDETDGDVICTFTGGSGDQDYFFYDDGNDLFYFSDWIQSASNMTCSELRVSSIDLAGNLEIDGYLDQKEIAEPAAPASNYVRNYNDSTSNDKMAKFDSGAAQQVKAHP